MSGQWNRIWHQAVTRSFRNGKAFGWNKTIAFRVVSPADGAAVRLRFSNRFGSQPYEIGAAVAISCGRSVSICLDGSPSLDIPVGAGRYSDACELPVDAGSETELRI